ncbi:MAG: hypothetical protein ACRDRO_15800, partial [Pseudonocardiaceae bacterium]
DAERRHAACDPLIWCIAVNAVRIVQAASRQIVDCLLTGRDDPDGSTTSCDAPNARIEKGDLWLTSPN